MNVAIIATVSADGFIARHAHELVDWSSQADKGTFVKLTRELGVIVMGSHTFNTITRDLTTHNRRVIIYTHHPDAVTAPGVETTSETPAQLLARLAKTGATGVAICGGSQIYTQFMRSGLVTDLYLVTEPILLGSGISLFHEPIKAEIALVETTVRRGRSIVNHYQVRQG